MGTGILGSSAAVAVEVFSILDYPGIPSMYIHLREGANHYRKLGSNTLTVDGIHIQVMW
jgi:hypothetical protein